MSLRESEVVLAVSLILREKFVTAGHVVTMTRVIESAISLKDRCFTSNAFDADLFISLHCNAAANRSASGIEVWTSTGRTKSDQWADAIMVELARAFPHENLRRDYTDGDADKESSSLYVLKHTSAPAVLAELGFISHPETEFSMRLPSWRESCAHAIAAAVGNA
jgi:N-acetylmuramoyl-L-alanine amidase